MKMVMFRLCVSVPGSDRRSSEAEAVLADADYVFELGSTPMGAGQAGLDDEDIVIVASSSSSPKEDEEFIFGEEVVRRRSGLLLGESGGEHSDRSPGDRVVEAPPVSERSPSPPLAASGSSPMPEEEKGVLFRTLFEDGGMEGDGREEGGKERKGTSSRELPSLRTKAVREEGAPEGAHVEVHEERATRARDRSAHKRASLVNK